MPSSKTQYQECSDGFVTETTHTRHLPADWTCTNLQTPLTLQQCHNVQPPLISQPLSLILVW